MGHQAGNEFSSLQDKNISPADILENISHSIIVTDLEGTVIYWNKGGVELFGYTKEEMIGQKASILYPTRNKENFDADLEKLNKREKISGQWLGKRKDGSWIWVDVETQLVKNGKGEPAAIIGSACDIEPQKKVEGRLEESQARAKSILETTVDGIITISSEGIVQSFNKAAENIFGYKEGEVIGKNVSILMPSPHRELHDDYIQRYLNTGEKKIIGVGREVRGKRKDGSTFPMELAVSEVTLDDEKIFTGSVKDITDRRTLENEILEISDGERRRIGQDLHDGLGQMLTGIGLMGQNLARKMEANNIPAAAEVRKITEMIKEADKYTRTLSHSLVPVELDINGLQTALEQLCNRVHRLFNIDCEFIEGGEVDIEKQHIAISLYRITQEAISNAVKHGKASEIKVRLEDRDHGILLVIEDDGIGFANTVSNDDSEGMGIHTMRYRAHISGGDLYIRETDEGLTRVECIIPNSENTR